MAKTNLALGKSVTGTTTVTNAAFITNGSITSADYAYESSGLEYAQVDLGAVYWLDMVKVWHYWADLRTYYATKTQVSSDGINWVTIFDSAITGTYVETSYGITHRFIAQPVRYIRDYTNGSTANAGNHWVEIQGYGYTNYSTTIANSFLRGNHRSRNLQNNANGINATGGTITFDCNYIIHTFTSNGVFSMPRTGVVEVLVVGGGAGGGSVLVGGGGGAGQYIYNENFSLSVGDYNVVIGSGGASGNGNNGGNTTFSSYTAVGGGGGGGGGQWNAGVNGKSGASGGGAAGEFPGSTKTGGSATAGNSGGNAVVWANSTYSSGGGGGAATAGGTSTSSQSGHGGAGIANSISGTIKYYAAGGGGSVYREGSSTAGRGLGGSGVGGNGSADGTSSVAGSAAVANTGSGGGGSAGGTGFAGAAGIVIIRYPINCLI